MCLVVHTLEKEKVVGKVEATEQVHDVGEDVCHAVHLRLSSIAKFTPIMILMGVKVRHSETRTIGSLSR